MKYAIPGQPGSSLTIKARYDNFIGGEWVRPAKGRYFENLSPITGKAYCEIARSDETNPDLYKGKTFDILAGPISPGSHTLSVLAVYKGHGYGVFKYLNKYTFTVRSSHTFTAAEGKATRVEAIGYEKGGQTTPLDKRPAIDFKVTAGTGEK